MAMVKRKSFPVVHRLSSVEEGWSVRQLPTTYPNTASMMSSYWSKEGVHLVGFVVGIYIVMQSLCLSRLSCGTTWHAAGLLGASRGSRAHTKIVTYSNELYAKLEEETGLGTGD